MSGFCGLGGEGALSGGPLGSVRVICLPGSPSRATRLLPQPRGSGGRRPGNPPSLSLGPPSHLITPTAGDRALGPPRPTDLLLHWTDVSWPNSAASWNVEEPWSQVSWGQAWVPLKSSPSWPPPAAAHILCLRGAVGLSLP